MKTPLDTAAAHKKKPAGRQARAAAPGTTRTSTRHTIRPRDLTSLSPEVQEIVRLARRLKGAFGPT